PKPLVFLESDTGGMPGAILDGPLTQINGIARFDAGSGMVQFDCVSCPRLSKGTTYWIVVAPGDPNQQVSWLGSIDDTASENLAVNQSGSPTGRWSLKECVARAAFTVEADTAQTFHNQHLWQVAAGQYVKDTFDTFRIGKQLTGLSDLGITFEMLNDGKSFPSVQICGDGFGGFCASQPNVLFNAVIPPFPR